MASDRSSSPELGTGLIFNRLDLMQMISAIKFVEEARQLFERRLTADRKCQPLIGSFFGRRFARVDIRQLEACASDHFEQPLLVERAGNLGITR